VFCQNTSDSHCNGCVASEKSKTKHKSQSNRVRTEKVECQKEDDDDRRLLFSDKQEEGKLTWLEVEDSGRGSCSDESQVLSLVDTTTIISGRKVSPSTGEDDESAYCYAYSNPNQTKPSCSNPNQIPRHPSPNLYPVSSWNTEEMGNIYEEIRPLKKTSSNSDQVTKEKSREESAQSDLVLNISPRKSNRQRFYRFTDWDLAVDLRDPVEAFQPVPQMKALGASTSSQLRERGTQTEEGRINGDLDSARKRGEEREMVKGGLVKNNREGEEKEEEEVVIKGRRRSRELSRKVTLSKSFSRLLSFRRVKK